MKTIRIQTMRWCVTGLALMLAACAPTPAQTDADPALWVVRDADTTVYLFGTVHVLKPGLTWFDEAVRDAFGASSEVVLELVMPPASEMQALVAELGASASAKPLSAQLPAETLARMRAALEKHGLSPDMFEHSDPWLAATTLSLLPIRAHGYAEKDGAEAVLRSAAEREGKTLTGLETAREQLSYFDGLSPAAQRKLLIETVDALPHAAKTIDGTVAAWSAGDADTLAKLINEDLRTSPELADWLLIQRNRNWAEWVKHRMDRPGTVFLAVGAGHLAGDNSLQRELTQRGMRVMRVHY